MIFGDVSNFAIEAMSEVHLVPPSPVWGRRCVHVGGLVLGDYSEAHCGLFGAYSGFDRLRKHAGELWDVSFDGCSEEQIHDLVDRAIYGEDYRSDDQVASDAKRFSKFDFLTNWDEQFDGYKSVIVLCAPDLLRITHRPDSWALVSKSCTLSGFVDAASRFVAWYDAESIRLDADRSGQQDA